METSPLNLDPLQTPKKQVVHFINHRMNFGYDHTKQEIVDKFWLEILAELKEYNEHLQDSKPFEKTCYSCCSNKCIKKWDRSFWEFKMVGYRKRMYVSEYKYPTKLISVLLVFVAGVFKLIRANQDGKASFYGNIINILTSFMILVLFYRDGERVMLIPKIGAILVSASILYGIVSNAENGKIGI
jgi:hypothetical protein